MNILSGVILSIPTDVTTLEWVRATLPRVFSCDPDWSVDRDSEVIVHTDAVESYLDDEDGDEDFDQAKVDFLVKVMGHPQAAGATLRFYIPLSEMGL